MPTYVKDKKVSLNYEIIKKFEAGISLLGYEVKSVKNNQGSLDGSFVSITNGEAILKKAHIPAYQPKNTPSSYDPYRDRKILLNKSEIESISKKEKGLTIVPISMYSKGTKIKLEIAIVRGKKKHDKRQDIKKKDTERDLGRTLKG